MTEAFYFSRGHPEPVHRHLLEELTGFVHSGASGDTRSDNAVELISLPFDETEEQWFEDFLLNGKGRAFHAAKDTIMMRRIACGKTSEAFETPGLAGRKVDGVNWDSLKESIQKGAGPRVALHEMARQ